MSDKKPVTEIEALNYQFKFLEQDLNAAIRNLQGIKLRAQEIYVRTRLHILKTGGSA